ITTVVGNHSFGFAGDGGPATKATFSCPTSIAFDTAGKMYVVDANNNRLRMVDTQGIVTTIAGNGFRSLAQDGLPASTTTPLGYPYFVTLDSANNIYLSELFGRVRKLSVNGRILSTVAGAGSLAVDGVSAQASLVSAPSQ